MSFWKHCYHIVWSTKERELLILPDIEPRLYAYLVSKSAEMGVFVYAINGTEDHTHVVAAIPPKHSVAWVVKMLKGASAHFVNTELRPPGLHFAWQRGCGSLTIGERQRPSAIEYVQRQKEHHRDHATNIWLERCDDEDQGDSDEIPTSPVTRESVSIYDAVLDLPW